MPVDRSKPTLGVVSPFIDKQHGTERCVAEQIERLSEYYETHIYSSRVTDLESKSVIWHRVPKFNGPEILKFPLWLLANSAIRWKDRLSGLRMDVLYSPGPNCFSADIVSVHALFARLRRIPELNQRNANTKRFRGVHRRMYYWLGECAERIAYRNPRIALAAISAKTASDLSRLFGRKQDVIVIRYGVDAQRYSRQRCDVLRAEARRAVGLSDDSVGVLLIGNDWKSKGLPTLIQAVADAANPRAQILVVGVDSGYPQDESFQSLLREKRILLLPLRSDVEFYYAASDVYASPSLEDAFALPVLESMACGLPVITSSAAGVSEIIHHGEDGFILADPRDAKTLAGYVAQLSNNAALREEIGQAAARTAANYTWDRNAEQLHALIEQVLAHR
jgi:glycosyltransferase involved in cell wall biosynthesis